MKATRDQRLVDLGVTAKAVASGIFLSGRTLDDLLAHSVKPIRSDGVPIAFAIDDRAGTVVASSPDGLLHTALTMGDQGVTLLPPGWTEPRFQPVPVPRTPAPWPRPDAPEPAVDKAALEQAVALAFPAEPDIATAALIVVHRGHIITEHYRSGITADTPLQFWSVGKSILALQVGIAVGDGLLDLDAPAPFPEWHQPSDPRQSITLRHCLRMSSGLGFSAEWAPEWRPGGVPDHGYIYSGLVNSARLALESAAIVPPDTSGVYRNSDTILLQEALARALRAAGEHPYVWPHARLFAPLGCAAITLECDPYGNPLPSGWVFGTARDLARLALLMLRDGIWNGQRILPPGWVDIMCEPAPGWRGRYWLADAPPSHQDSIYGGHLWLNRFAPADRWPLPSDAAYMLGIGGQYAWIVPSLDLLIIRLGHVRGMLERGAGREPLASAFGRIAEVVTACEAPHADSTRAGS